MRVDVAQRFVPVPVPVPVPVRVRLHHRAIMGVLVMLVVNVPVFVFQHLVQAVSGQAQGICMQTRGLGSL